MVCLFFLTFCFDVRLFTVVVGEKCSLGEKSSQKKPPTHVHIKRERERERKMSQAAKKLIPLLDRVLVERAVAATKTSGGILLPETVGSKVRFLVSLSVVVDFFFFLLLFFFLRFFRLSLSSSFSSSSLVLCVESECECAASVLGGELFNSFERNEWNGVVIVRVIDECDFSQLFS
jgi:hypothetical protein